MIDAISCLVHRSPAHPACNAPATGRHGLEVAIRNYLPAPDSALKHQQRVDTRGVPSHAPVQMRAGRPAGRTDFADDLALLDRLPDTDVHLRQMQEVRADAVAVVDEHGAAGQIEVVGEDHAPGGRRFHRRAGGGGDVHAGMRRSRRAVVDALIAETTADSAGHRSDEVLGEADAVVAGLASPSDGLLLPADDPRAFLQLETLVSNWLVRTAELIGAELLDACGDWPELRRYLLRDPLLATRELDRLRNRLNTQLRWADWVERPIQLYESQRTLFQLRSGRIEPLQLTEPRDKELNQLGWWQRQVALLLEARDALAPQVQALVRRIGDLAVILLTQVLGRAIGLVGRGIAQGMGRSFGRS